MRWALILYGLAVLVWLQVEDNSTPPVAALGAGGAILLLLRLARTPGGQKRAWLPCGVVAAGLGAATGAGAALATALLMLLKTGLHSHLFPDYPPAQMIALLSRAPIWALAGAVAGVGLWLVEKGLTSPARN